MTFDEYAREAARTRSDEPSVVVAALGLTGESGEVADMVKKWLAQGHSMPWDKVILELGDILWYIALAAEAAGTTLDEVAARNIAKLAARYPEGFSSQASQHRVD